MVIYLLIGAVIGFVVGWLVTRNNTSIFEPFAEKIDSKFDILKAEIEQLKDKIDKK